MVLAVCLVVPVFAVLVLAFHVLGVCACFLFVGLVFVLVLVLIFVFLGGGVGVWLPCVGGAVDVCLVLLLVLIFC